MPNYDPSNLAHSRIAVTSRRNPLFVFASQPGGSIELLVWEFGCGFYQRSPLLDVHQL